MPDGRSFDQSGAKAFTTSFAKARNFRAVGSASLSFEVSCPILSPSYSNAPPTDIIVDAITTDNLADPHLVPRSGNGWSANQGFQSEIRLGFFTEWWPSGFSGIPSDTVGIRFLRAAFNADPSKLNFTAAPPHANPIRGPYNGTAHDLHHAAYCWKLQAWTQQQAPSGVGAFLKGIAYISVMYVTPNSAKRLYLVVFDVSDRVDKFMGFGAGSTWTNTTQALLGIPGLPGSQPTLAPIVGYTPLASQSTYIIKPYRTSDYTRSFLTTLWSSTNPRLPDLTNVPRLP